MPHPSERRAATPAQRAVLAAIRDHLGPLTTSTRELAAGCQLTVKQTEQALTALINANALTKAWDADRYLWTYTLVGAE